MADRLAKKLLLIGWDAADWKLASPLVDQGHMPTLGRLIDAGVMGNLAALRPMLSPMLWNSIATGKRPPQHGIVGFLEPDPHSGGTRPVGSTSRRVKALWNIVMQRGLRAHVVGWFAGCPAEPIDGVYVSPVYAQPSGSAGQRWPLPAGTVHPESSRDLLAGLRVHPADLPSEMLLGFVPRADEVDQQHDRRLEHLRLGLAESASIHNAATWVLEHEPWDLLAVGYDTIGFMGRHFMRFHPPRMPDVHPRQFELYKDVMTGIYRFYDLLLERLLELAGPDATVVLVSAHGAHSDHLRSRGGGGLSSAVEEWNRDSGILCMKGPHIRRDEHVYGATVLDVAPTVLTLLGLPVGEDMAGKPLVQSLEELVEPERIPSWEREPGECGMHGREVPRDPAAVDAALQQLVALGYVEAPGPDPARARAMAHRDLQYNLARSYVDAGRSDQAVPILLELSAAQPDDARLAFTLGHCYVDLGRRAEARALVEPLVDSGDGGPWADWLLGIIESQDGRVDAALLYFARAEAANMDRPDLYVQIGNAYVREALWDKARGVFERALAVDSDCAEAYLGLAVIASRGRRHEEAAEHALTAVGLRHLLPQGHYQLGVALAHLGHTDRAIVAFEMALHQAPNIALAHRWLVRLALKAGDPVRAAKHDVLWSQLRRRQRVTS